MNFQALSKLSHQWMLALIMAATAITGTIVFYGISQSRQTSKPTVVAKAAPIIRKITALGRLESTTEVIKVSVPATLSNDRVTKLLVQRGDRVKAGQVIAIMDAQTRLQNALLEAQAQVKVSLADLAKVKAGAKSGEIAAQKAEIARFEQELKGKITTQQATIARWQTEVRTAKADYNRYLSLYKQGATAALELDRKQLILETAQAQLNEAQANQNQSANTLREQIRQARGTLDKIAEVRPVDILVAQAEIEKAISAARKAKANLGEAYIRAPISGRILNIYTQPGEVATWRNPENQTSRQIFVYGIDPNRPVFDLPEVNQHLDELKLLNRALFDRASGLPQIGDVPTLLEKENPLSVQANDYEIKIVGLFTLGVSFSAEGNLITSDSTFLRLFTRRQANEIDVGIIKVESNATIEQVQANLQAILPDNLLVLTLDEFAAREFEYWNTGSAIGPIFNLGVAIGFLVGAVIVYQILYTDVSDHLSEYATLKAMGYNDAYFIGLIIQEALLLAVLGFVPGFLLSSGLYALFKSATLLPIAMKLTRATTVLVLTIIMCVGAGAIAMRKLRAADPADIF